MTKKDVIYVVFSRLWSSFMQLWIVKGNLVNVLDYRFSLHDKCAQMEDQKTGTETNKVPAKQQGWIPILKNQPKSS